MHKTREDYQRFHHSRYQQLLELLARHAPERQERCLDVGGGGDIAEMVTEIKAKYADEFHTVDLATDIDRLRKKGIQAQISNVDVQALPYEDGYFDIVIFASVLEHLYNPKSLPPHTYHCGNRARDAGGRHFDCGNPECRRYRAPS